MGCVGVFMGVVMGVWVNVNVFVYSWGGWVGWVFYNGTSGLELGERESTLLYDTSYIKRALEKYKIIPNSPPKKKSWDFYTI